MNIENPYVQIMATPSVIQQQKIMSNAKIDNKHFNHANGVNEVN